MKKIILFVTLLCMTVAMYGQVKGVVKDQDGHPLMGVAVESEKGSTTTTDLDGNFVMNVPIGSKISVSFLGYRSQVVRISSTNMQIVMHRKGAKPIKEASDTPWSMFILANGMSSYPVSPAIGLTFGMVRKGGWYVNAMVGFGNHFAPDDVRSLSSLNSMDAPFLTGKRSCQTISATFGGLVRMGQAPVYGYLGLGYGYKSITYETNANKWIAFQTSAGSDWSPMHGMALETGLMANIKGFSISLGYEAILGIANPVNAVSVAHELKIGLGGMFAINRRTNK